MPQDKAGVATTILAPEPSGEGFVEISPNKTLFIQKLTAEDPVTPEIVNGLDTVEAVFNHFKPNCEVELEKEDGSTLKENFMFSGLGDFDAEALTNQSGYLKNLGLEGDAYLKIVNQLRSNTTLTKVVENPESKAAFINALRSLAAELEEGEA